MCSLAAFLIAPYRVCCRLVVAAFEFCRGRFAYIYIDEYISRIYIYIYIRTCVVCVCVFLCVKKAGRGVLQAGSEANAVCVS